MRDAFPPLDLSKPEQLEAVGRALIEFAAKMRQHLEKKEQSTSKRYPKPTVAGAGRAERWLAATVAQSPSRKVLTRPQFIEKARELGCSRRDALDAWRKLVTNNAAASKWREPGRPKKTRPERRSKPRPESISS